MALIAAMRLFAVLGMAAVSAGRPLSSACERKKKGEDE